jgi:SAM-dependent methyltransferase
VLRLLASVAFSNLVRPLYLDLRMASYKVIDHVLRVTTVNEQIARQLSIHDYYPFGALGWASCWRVLHRLPKGPDEVFLDIGCGAGRMTCAAAHKVFGRVIGVEISPALAKLAQANTAALRRSKSACEIICADAQEYRIPDDVTVIFMYNPFAGRVFVSTLNQIVDSYDRNPRKIVVAYANPLEHLAVVNCPRFRALQRIHLSWRPSPAWKRTQAIQLYELLPKAEISNSDLA